MKNDLKFYTNTQSRGAVVDWLLIELGVTCERIEVAYQTEMKAPEYLKIHPFGKVPALVDGDVAIYELGAVCAYLTDKFADKGLAPALNDPKEACTIVGLCLFQDLGKLHRPIKCWGLI
jgi:glutathione S-transferase